MPGNERRVGQNSGAAGVTAQRHHNNKAARKHVALSDGRGHTKQFQKSHAAMQFYKCIFIVGEYTEECSRYIFLNIFNLCELKCYDSFKRFQHLNLNSKGSFIYIYIIYT